MKRYGLIGKSLQHSFSKNYFAQKFTEEGIRDCSYDNFELSDIDQLPSLITTLPELKGLNVTLPYKESVLAFLDSRDVLVEEAGACNCICISDGKLKGFNTDIPAFEAALQPRLLPEDKCALILGAGGASKAVQHALRKMGIDFLVVTRNKEDYEIGYEDLGRKLIEEHQIIINTTPVGMYPNTEEDPSLPYEAIGSDHLLFDLIYNPPETKFLLQGKANGARTANGYDMLVRQAEESWKIWTAIG